VKLIKTKGVSFMTQTQEKTLPETEIKLPSFSMIYETENLSSVELENIYRSLASIANQDISPEQVLEVFQEDPRRILMLPLAIPIILWFRLLFLVGQIVTYFQPDLLLKLYKNVASKSERTASINL
jgi:hypothetical protein